MITELRNGFIGVEVEPHHQHFAIEGNRLIAKYMGLAWSSNEPSHEEEVEDVLCEFTYPCDPIGMANGLSEEQKAEIVELLTIEATRVPIKKYRNYADPKGVKFNYAAESFDSLCASHNLNPNTTFILKRKN